MLRVVCNVVLEQMLGAHGWLLLFPAARAEMHAHTQRMRRLSRGGAEPSPASVAPLVTCSAVPRAGLQQLHAVAVLTPRLLLLTCSSHTPPQRYAPVTQHEQCHSTCSLPHSAWLPHQWPHQICDSIVERSGGAHKPAALSCFQASQLPISTSRLQPYQTEVRFYIEKSSHGRAKAPFTRNTYPKHDRHGGAAKDGVFEQHNAPLAFHLPALAATTRRHAKSQASCCLDFLLLATRCADALDVSDSAS